MLFLVCDLHLRAFAPICFFISYVFFDLNSCVFLRIVFIVTKKGPERVKSREGAGVMTKEIVASMQDFG